MHLSDDFLQQWDHIISSVDKSNIPLECINKMILRLYGGRQKTVNLSKLRQQGLDNDEIETVLSRNIAELEDQVRDIDFILDIKAVAELIQPETDKLLNGL
jgi:hypothetical protein